ncbi:hypothetical protein BH11PSE4_BH11PSE4_17410 [soil metagenome]
MRTISFVLAFAFVLAGPSIAGSYDGDMPGIGTFSFNSASQDAAPQMIAIAAY